MASHDTYARHRALQILRPTSELSGTYTCIVSTFLEERKHRVSLLVYGEQGGCYTCIVSTFVEEQKHSVSLLVYGEETSLFMVRKLPCLW